MEGQFDDFQSFFFFMTFFFFLSQLVVERCVCVSALYSYNVNPLFFFSP